MSDAIAVVDITESVPVPVSGEIFDGKKVSRTSLIAYQSQVVRTLYGTLPAEPLIVQFDGAADRNALEKGRYLLFLKSEGRLYSPIETVFRVADGKAAWFLQPFLTGAFGPVMGEVPLPQVLSEVTALIQEHKGRAGSSE